MTERARRKYAAVFRRRYVVADTRVRGACGRVPSHDALPPEVGDPAAGPAAAPGRAAPRRVTSGLYLLRQRLPIPLRAWHSDNGGSNGEIFYSLKEAQIVIEQWRVQENTRRPHASLGYRPPARPPITPSSLPTQFHNPSVVM